MDKVKKIILYLVIIIVALSILYPLCFTIITSFRDKQDYLESIYAFDFSSLNLDNYKNMVKNFDVLLKIRNSLVITLGGTILTLVLGIPAAYYMNYISKKAYLVILVFLAIFAFLPEQVIIFFQYIIFMKLGLVNNYISVILIFTAKNLPESMIFASLIFRRIPHEILEAAQLDGCKKSKLLSKIALPLSIPGLAIILVNLTLNMWNNFLVPLTLLQDNSKKAIVPSLAVLDHRYAANQPYQMAGNVLAMIPIVLIYLCCKNKIIDSVYGNTLK